MASTVYAPEGKRFGGWAGIFILVALLLGGALLVLPPHWIILLLAGAAIGGYLVLHPAKCFYLVIFTIPFAERVRVLPISFSPLDLAILLCVGVVGLHMLFRSQHVSFKTRIDGWIWMLTVVFLLAGIFSESSRGVLGFFKFFEAVVVYYLAVYFMRTRQITRSKVLKTILITALFQACLGILQSVTGSFGADFMSQRGYLGYLGLGSSTVWHGEGTMGHFNALGNFLTNNFLFFLPFLWFGLRRNPRAKFLALVILAGLLMTYSRGSLLGLITGSLFFMALVQKMPKRAFAVVAGLAVLGYSLSQSAYVDTLSYQERLVIWQVPLAAITSSAKALWLGSGLNSYEIVAWPYIPANVPMSEYHNWFAHNFYLLTVLEIGLIGAAILFGFLFFLWYSNLQTYRHQQGARRLWPMALSVMLVSIFFVSIFDHAYSSPYFRIYLFLLLGLFYVKPRSMPQGA